MQVFEIFTYNLNSIKFKDTKDYFDGLLEKFGISYTDIMFCFTSDFSGNLCKKVVKTFPQLSEYIKHLEESERYFKSVPDNCFTSIWNNNGQIAKYIKAEQVEDFSALLRKIPNPINFGFMGVVLDNINWYKDEVQKPTFYSPTDNIDYYNHRFNTYFSNSIRFFKEFDFGNKLNIVDVVIERQIDNDSLRQYPGAFNELLARLGTPINSKLECVFNAEENKVWSDSSKKFKQLVEENNKICVPFSKNKQYEVDENYLIDSITPISGFSPKTVFKKIAKGKGYKYCFCKNGCYRFQHINSNKHIFTVELMNIPFSSFFDASISAKGYNYEHTVCYTGQVRVKSVADAEAFAKSVFSIADEAECKYADKLLSLYGKTPDWFVDK